MVVAFDKIAVSSKRPEAFMEHERTQVRRHSSVGSPEETNQAAAKFRQQMVEKDVTEWRDEV